MFGQLDRPSIVIRKRTLLELAELSLCVVRDQGMTLAFLFFLLAIPFALLNYVLLETLGPWTAMDMEEFQEFAGVYCIALWCLMLLEMPLAASLLTTYLGRFVFMLDDRPRKSDVFLTWFASFGQLLYYLLLVRVLVGWVAPFLSPIILLERTPFSAGKEKKLTTWGRSRILHSDQLGNSLVVFCVSCVFTALLSVGFCYIAWIGAFFIFGLNEESDPFWIVTTLFPAVFWCVAFYLSVFHFFRYLDLRIEREGWDVELAFRAERARIESGMK